MLSMMLISPHFDVELSAVSMDDVMACFTVVTTTVVPTTVVAAAAGAAADGSDDSNCNCDDTYFYGNSAGHMMTSF